MEKPTQDEGQLSLSGSRTLLKQLRPKGTSNALLQHSERNKGGSSSGDEHANFSVNEYTSGEDSEDSRSSSIGHPDRSKKTSELTTSPFRSILRGGGASNALALKTRLGRLRKKGSTQEKIRSGSGGGKTQLLGRGKGFRRGKPGSRPPVQHADSLSSGEGAKDSDSASIASGDGMRSSGSFNEEGFLSPERLATSSSEGDDDDADDDDDEDADEETLESKHVRGKGTHGGDGNPMIAAEKPRSQASQLRSGLLRLTRQRSPQLRAPRLSAPSDSSATTSTREKGDKADQSGVAGSSDGRASAGVSLLGSRLDRGGKKSSGSPRDVPGRRNRDGDGGRRRQKTSTGTGVSSGGEDSGGESPTWSPRSRDAPLPEGRKWMLPSWQSLVRGRGPLEDTGEQEMAVVSGVGRPAAGMMENAMYEWFGGIVGRAWPGVGLARRPVVSEEGPDKVNARIDPHEAALEDDVMRVHVIATDALPEDSRITRPMIVVHIVDSSTGRYLRRAPPPKADTHSEPSPERSRYDETDGDETHHNMKHAQGQRKHQKQRGAGTLGAGNALAEAESARLVFGGATTTFEERTVWNFVDGGKPETGRACGIVPPVATKPWMMTMRSPTPIWEEALVFAESYRRLLTPESLVLFELVDFAAALSHKEARKGGGLAKIAWAFLRPIGAGGECNVGVRNDNRQSSSPDTPVDRMGQGGDCSRRSRLQLYKHQPLSVVAKWQARQRGFPRLYPPVAPEVPDVFLQFLLFKRTRYPATLAVSVGPTPRPKPVLVARRPMVSHEREGHQLSYEALAAMHQKSRQDREKDEAAGILPSGVSSGGGAAGGAGGGAGASAASAARSRRLRAKNEPCVLPHRLLHRVYAGQNGAITLAFSRSGALLAAACCDDPLPGRFPIRLIDSETGRCRHELRGHASMVYSLEWSPGDSFLLSASADGTAKVWCVSAGTSVAGVHDGGVGSGGGGGAPASAEGLPATAQRCCKDELPRLVCVLQHAPPCFVYAAAFQPAEVMDRTRGATAPLDQQPRSEASECALVVTGAYDRRLRLWDVTAATATAASGRAKMLGTLSSKAVHESHVNAIVYDPKNSRLYSGDGAGVIVVWRRGGGSSGRGGILESYGILRKVQHVDLAGKAITSLALAPRLRRGQLLVQAHGNTLRLLDLGTYQLVNPGFAGGATAESLVRASFSPDGRFVVSGSEKGQVRVWEAQEGQRVRTPLQSLGTACCLRDVAWHPHQHVLALAGFGQDAPVLLYCGEARVDKLNKRDDEVEICGSSLAMKEQAAREAHASAEEHRRRLENRQRLRELRIKRLRAKALGLVDGPIVAGPGNNRAESGVAAALAALTAGAQKSPQGATTAAPV